MYVIDLIYIEIQIKRTSNSQRVSKVFKKNLFCRMYWDMLFKLKTVHIWICVSKSILSNWFFTSLIVLIKDGVSPSGSKTSMMLNKTKHLCSLPGGILGPYPGARHGEGVRRWVPGGQAFFHGIWSGSAWKGNMDLSSCGLTTHRRSHRGPVLFGSSGSPRQGPWRSDPRLPMLAIGTWNVASLLRKEPELVQEVERYWLSG